MYNLFSLGVYDHNLKKHRFWDELEGREYRFISNIESLLFDCKCTISVLVLPTVDCFLKNYHFFIRKFISKAVFESVDQAKTRSALSYV